MGSKKVLSVLAFVVMTLPAWMMANQAQDSQQTTSQGIAVAQEGNTYENTERINNPEVGTMTEAQIRTMVEEQLEENKPEYAPKDETARKHMSAASDTAEKLIRFSERLGNEEIGEEIREVARLHVDSADQVNKNIDSVSARNVALKFFLGPNYDQLKNIRQEVEQNQVRIRQMNQILAQLQNEADQTELKVIIQTMEAENTALQDRQEELEDSFSLLGWMFRWLDKY